MSSASTRTIEDGWVEALELPDESERLETLHRYEEATTEASQNFDRITQLLCSQFDAAFSFVSLVDKDKQWFKSKCGIDVEETPKERAFCAHAIWEDEPLIILNALKDDRFRKNPLVEGEPYIRFYAGAQLINKDGHRLGTLCVFDTNPRAEVTKKELDLLVSLSQLVVDEVDLHLEKAELEKKSHTKSAFLANMSHEIRTPMNGVIGMASMLGTTALDQKQKQYLDTIIRSGEVLLEIINDILDVSKIEAGHFEIESIAFDLRQVLTDVLDIFSAEAKAKGLELFLEYPSGVDKHYLGDPLRLRQIFMNLVSNAVKFTQIGHVRVIVNAEYESDSEASLCITVSDTGIGIPEHKQDKVFDKFAQSEVSKPCDHDGKGLGLSICQSLTELMGGNISLMSVPGKGSNFQVNLTLPKSEASEVVGVNEQTIEDTDIDQDSSVGRSCSKNSKILVAEDNKVNQMVITAMLEELGYEVDLACDGEEVLKLANNEDYDLILMDCNMPKRDGYDATRKIRENEEEDRKVIIALTANVLESDRDRCIDAGMDDFIGKPVNLDNLSNTLNKWLPGS